VCGHGACMIRRLKLKPGAKVVSLAERHVPRAAMHDQSKTHSLYRSQHAVFWKKKIVFVSSGCVVQYRRSRIICELNHEPFECLQIAFPGSTSTAHSFIQSVSLYRPKLAQGYHGAPAPSSRPGPSLSYDGALFLPRASGIGYYYMFGSDL
jgi:hypothetical protein